MKINSCILGLILLSGLAGHSSFAWRMDGIGSTAGGSMCRVWCDPKPGSKSEGAYGYTGDCTKVPADGGCPSGTEKNLNKSIKTSAGKIQAESSSLKSVLPITPKNSSNPKTSLNN